MRTTAIAAPALAPVAVPASASGSSGAVKASRHGALKTGHLS
ncbi:hypothetical protein [Streptomyces sp. NPDC013187]